MRRTRRIQHGGGWGYNTVAGVTPGGVPFESRTPYDHCYGDMRTAPAVTPTGAMLQSGGGSATGGYGFQLDNSLGKVYADLPKGPCMVTQSGGAAVDEYGVVSYPAGYGFDKAHAVVTPSAMYLDRVAYDRTCQGGGARKQVSGARKSRKNRKHRKSRKAVRKANKRTSRKH